MQGRIQNFHVGGGAHQIMVVHTYHKREARSPYGRGPGPSSLEALQVFDAISCYMSLIFKLFKHSDAKWEKKYCQSKLGGGGGTPAAPPSGSTTIMWIFWDKPDPLPG